MADWFIFWKESSSSLLKLSINLKLWRLKLYFFPQVSLSRKFPLGSTMVQCYCVIFFHILYAMVTCMQSECFQAHSMAKMKISGFWIFENVAIFPVIHGNFSFPSAFMLCSWFIASSTLEMYNVLFWLSIKKRWNEWITNSCYTRH